MLKIPSYKAAAIFGAIGMPVFVYVLKIIEDKSINQIALIIWAIIGFGLPMLISTCEFNYIRKEMKEGRSFFGPWTKSQDFKEFFFPTWKRMSVWFLAACISLLLLNRTGVI